MSGETDDAGANRPARDPQFLLERWWFLRQVVADAPECAAVAIALADHANRETGLMFPSIGTIAEALGRSTRAVQPHLARLERRRHIVFAGWVSLSKNANVKSWRWSLWDERVRNRFDVDLLGDGRSGRKLHDRARPAKGSLRKKAAQPPDDRSGSNASAAPEVSGVSAMKDSSYKPVLEPVLEPATTTTSSLPPDSGDHKVFEDLARLLDQAITPARRKKWKAQLFDLACLGVDFRLHLRPAIEDALVEATAGGKDLRDTNSLLRFKEPALERVKVWAMCSPDLIERFLSGCTERADAVIAARLPTETEPKAPAKKFTQREQDERRRKRHRVLQALGIPVSLTMKAPWFTNQIVELETAGISFEAIIGACRRAGALGSLDNLKRQGGLTALVERHLRSVAHAHPAPSTMN